MEFHAGVQAGGGVGGDVVLETLQDACGVLAGDQAEGDFGAGFGGDDGFGAGALVAAVDAVDVGGGARPETFQAGAALLAGGGGEADFAEEGGFVEAERAPFGELGGGGFGDAVVEVFQGDAALGVGQAGQEFW